MANKDLFKQAIAEAKSVRAAAIANAKEALEETLTPHIKDMLAAKLQEMEDSSVEEEVVNEVEEVEEEVSENLIPVQEAEEEDETEEAEEEAAEEEAEESEDNDSEESEEEAEEEAEEDEDVDIKDMDVEELKDLIRTIVAQETDLEGEEALDGAEDLTGDEEELDAAGMEAGEEIPAGIPADVEAEEDEEEINLEALLSELEALAETDEAVCSTCGKTTTESGCNKHEGHCNEVVNEEEEVKEEEEVVKEGEKEEVKEEEKEEVKEEVTEETNGELEEALATIETLRTELNETNILNAKLLYVNKILKANRNLSESQVVNVISAFDKAETVKEVKLVFETVSENVVVKSNKSTIKESKLGSASKATGLTGKKPEVISEANAAVLRMQKLAGIIK